MRERDKRRERFKLRAPYMAIENERIPDHVASEDAWKDATDWVARIKPERVHSFKLQVNFKREPKSIPAKGNDQ